MRNAALTCLAILAGGAGLLTYATDNFQAFTSEGARRVSIAAEARPVPDIMLETMDENHVRLHQPGKVVVAEFIYTTCPVICQTAGSHLSQLTERISTEGLADDVQVLSISFDPQRDRPAELTLYGNRHKADGKVWTITRPDPAVLPALLDRFGVEVIPDPWGGFEHNAAMHIVDPKGRLSAIVDIEDVPGALSRIKALQQ